MYLPGTQSSLGITSMTINKFLSTTTLLFPVPSNRPRPQILFLDPLLTAHGANKSPSPCIPKEQMSAAPTTEMPAVASRDRAGYALGCFVMPRYPGCACDMVDDARTQDFVIQDGMDFMGDEARERDRRVLEAGADGLDARAHHGTRD